MGNPDEGFSSFEQATFRKYAGLTKQIKPDMEVYDRNKAKAGDAFYAQAGTVVHGVHKDSPEAIKRMADDVQKQKEKRDKFLGEEDTILMLILTTSTRGI